MKDALDLDLVLISADSSDDNYTSAILNAHEQCYFTSRNCYFYIYNFVISNVFNLPNLDTQFGTKYNLVDCMNRGHVIEIATLLISQTSLHIIFISLQYPSWQ